MLCSLQLNGLVSALPPIAVPADYQGKQVAFRVGEQYRIVTIDLEPNDSPEKLGKLRDRYIARLPEDQQAKARAGGWTFLTAGSSVEPGSTSHTSGLGDAAQIHRVAESVGFKYVYLKDKAEYAHPAALIFLASTGRVIRYVYGIEYAADVMRESLIAAGTAEPKAAAGYMLRCYHFDPDAKNHSYAGVIALRIGAASFVVLLAGFGVFALIRRNRS
jgi:protein SCO1/2